MTIVLYIHGLGVIENDFHDRKDLTPNICAVYTEEAYCGQGIAGRLLDQVVEDLREKKGFLRFMFLPTTQVFMNAMDGSSSAWSMETANRICPGCMSIYSQDHP